MLTLALFNIAIKNPITSNVRLLAGELLDAGLIRVEALTSGDEDMYRLKYVESDQPEHRSVWLSPADSVLRTVIRRIFTENSGNVENYLVKNFEVGHRKAHHFMQNLDYLVIEEWKIRQQEIRKFSDIMMAMQSSRSQVDRCVPRGGMAVDVSSFVLTIPSAVEELLQEFINSHNADKDA